METYTPGYSEVAAAFMARRRLDPNGAFFLPHLKPGISVLDCGCGPGTITRDIARQVLPGRVTGVDFSADQVALATRDAKAQGIANAEFRPGGVLGVCTPDWGGFLLAPPSEKLLLAFEAYKQLQNRNGGDVYCGHKLGLYCGAGRFRKHRHAFALRELRSAHRDRRLPGGEP